MILAATLITQEISFLKIHTPLSKLTGVLLNKCTLFRKSKSVNFRLIPYNNILLLILISNQNCDVTMHVSIARIMKFIALL